MSVRGEKANRKQAKENLKHDAAEGVAIVAERPLMPDAVQQQRQSAGGPGTHSAVNHCRGFGSVSISLTGRLCGSSGVNLPHGGRSSTS